MVIFGGRHADVPLAPDNGAHIAEILVDQRFPSVLDLSGLRKGERHRFAVEFLETLYHRNQDPLHLVIDFTERAERCSRRSVRSETGG